MIWNITRAYYEKLTYPHRHEGLPSLALLERGQPRAASQEARPFSKEDTKKIDSTGTPTGRERADYMTEGKMRN